MAKVNWNVLVKSKDNAEEALKVLGANINPENPDCLMESDFNFVAAQDYITAVPVSIAMTVADRAALRKSNPDIKYIVTGVKAEDVPTMISDYGYITFDPIVVNKLNSKKEEEYTLDSDDVDRECTVQELGNIVAKYEQAKKMNEALIQDYLRRFNRSFGGFFDIDIL